MKKLDGRAAQPLRFLLGQVPAISLLDLESEPSRPVSGVDIVANIEVSGRRHALLCDVSASGRPRHVRIDLLQLHDAMISHPRNATPVLIAPFLSPEAQTLCREQEVSFLDLEGNARLIFDGIFIERQVASKPILILPLRANAGEKLPIICDEKGWHGRNDPGRAAISRQLRRQHDCCR